MDFALKRSARHAHFRIGDFAPLVSLDLAQMSDMPLPLWSIVRDFDEFGERASRRARFQRRRREADAFAEFARLVRHDERAGGVEQRDVAIGVSRRPVRRAKPRRYGLRRPPSDRPAAARFRPTSSGRNFESADLAVAQFDDARSGRWSSFRRDRRRHARSTRVPSQDCAAPRP